MNLGIMRIEKNMRILNIDTLPNLLTSRGINQILPLLI